jgi:HPt (histidine-containing phosphotransfer) domain-containing protein
MPSAGDEPAIAAAIAAMWESRRHRFAARVAVIEAALAPAAAAPAAEAERAAAEREAHKLAGALGTFGLASGSRIARRLELALATGRPEGREAESLARLAAELRREIEHGPA